MDDTEELRESLKQEIRDVLMEVIKEGADDEDSVFSQAVIKIVSDQGMFEEDTPERPTVA